METVTASERGDDLFVFRKFRVFDDERLLTRCHKAALDKLHTLFPDKKVTRYDLTTLGIQTDSYYSLTGIDTYELGMVNDEVPAMRNTRDGEVITYRIDA